MDIVLFYSSECKRNQKSTQFHRGSCYEKFVILLKKEELKNWKTNVGSYERGV